jgi:hypothetical protein
MNRRPEGCLEEKGVKRGDELMIGRNLYPRISIPYRSLARFRGIWRGAIWSIGSC